MSEIEYSYTCLASLLAVALVVYYIFHRIDKQ